MSALTRNPVVATLGGPGTFAGQATRAAMTWMAEDSTIQYFATIEAIWAALSSGAVDSILLSGETTNTGLEGMAGHLAAAETGLHVNGEFLVPYHCMLLGKPGTSVGGVKLVLGHNSLVHCRDFLARQLPQAEVRMHNQNSLAAAAEVLAGEGDIAVVGTQLSAEMNGLEVLAREIDQGSLGAWWFISRELRLSPHPDVLAVGVSSAAEGGLDALLSRMLAVGGVTLRGIAGVSARRIFSYDYLAIFSCKSLSMSPHEVLAGLDGCRLVGAFESVTADDSGHPGRTR